MSITYVSIDSKDRNKESKYLYSSKVSNIYNKASIELNSNELKLNSNNHGLSNGDKVSLEIVEASSHTLQNPFIYKNYNGTIFVYVYHPNVIDTVPLFDPNYNSILNIVIEDFEYPSGTANFSILTNNGTLELELSSLTHNLGSSENLTDLLKLNDKIQLDIDSDFISNNQIYTVYHLDTTTKIARVRCTHPKVEKFNSATCQWSFVNTLDNQNTIADIHSYFHLIQPPRLLYLEYSEFNALGLSNGWFLDWYKFELPSFISHSVSANTLIKNINFGGNVKIKLDTGIVHLSNNPLIITKNSNEITLMYNSWEFITELNQSDPINNPWNGTGESGSPSVLIPLNTLSSSNGQDLEIKIEWDNNLVNKVRVEINLADWGDYTTNTNNLYYGANPGGRCLNIADIKVFNQDGVNVATGATSQSTTQSGPYYGSGDYAIDGNTGTFNHTHGAKDGWFEVELSSLSVVSSIEITNRNTYNAREGADQNQIARVPTQIKLLDVNNNVLNTINPISWSTNKQTFTYNPYIGGGTSTRYFKGWPLDIVFDYNRTTSSTNSYTVSAKKTLEEDWVTRTQNIYKDGNNKWNWSFNNGMGSLSLGNNDSFGWKNYGFLLYGHNDPIKETAYFLFAGTDENKPLEAYEYNMSWSKVRVYARLITELNSAIHSDEVELHNIQPVSNVISNMEPVETKTYLKFTHDDLNKNFPVNLDILVNNYITFDFSESLTSVIAFKDGGLVNNDNSISFRVLKVNVFKQITLDLLYEIDTDLSYITNGLKWTAIINNTPYKGYVKTPIEYLPKEINQIKVGLSDSTVHYEKTYTDNVFMKITLGNTTNKSGFKVNTTGVNIGDNIEITTDTTDYIEFGDGSRIDNLNLSDSIIQEKLWTKYTIMGSGTKTFVFNESITFTNKANDSVNGIIYSNIPVDINNTYRVTVTGSSTAPANIWTGGIQSEVLSTTSSTISSEFIVTGNTLDIGVVFNTGTAVDSSFNITSVLLQQKVNQQFEVVAKSGNDLTLNAQKVITDIDSSNNSFKVNGNVATIDKTPIDITKAGNNKNPNVSINDINIKINRSNSTITYLDDEVENRSVVNGTIFDYQDSYVLIKLEKDIKSIILSGTPTFEFVGPDRVLYTGEINTANIVSEANSYFFRNMIDTSDKLKFSNVGINFKTEALNSNTAFDIVDFDYAKDEATINLNREIKNVNVINDNLEDINIVHLNNISSTEQANWSLFMNDFNTDYQVIGSNATSLKLQGSLVNKHNVYRFGGRFGWLKWKDNIGGIHNNYLNADLPQLEKEQAYHEITNVNGDNFSIILSNNAKVGVVNGGDHIRIKQILDNVVGYPNPNSYRIYLRNPISNVISVKMESTEFTNTSFIITDSNNKIYWQNELDGDYVYNVTLNNGYYYYDTLANEIQNKMGKVNRIYDAEGVTHKVLANVNTETQEFTLQSYNEVILNNPVSTSENSRVITISHNNHGLTTGDTITIFDSISVGRIPSTQINGEHEIIVLNDNAYTINVTTPTESALLDQGGTIFAVLSYNKIRLRLDYENTIGNILGFDNTDIQDYSIKVSNKEYNKGLKHINLFGNRYILMKCKTDKDFGVLQTNSLRDVFAKIQLNEMINNNIFNSFISRLKVFTDPITIEFIDIELYDENGKLFDFSDLDHSFTISVEQRI